MIDNISAASICAPVFSYKTHTHPMWELIYYTNGDGDIIINDQTYGFESGMIYVIPPNTPHSENGPGGYTTLYVNFNDDTLAPTPFYASDNSSRDIYNLLLILQREYLLHLKNHDIIISLLLETVLAYMNVLSSTNNPTDHVAKMRQIIIDSYLDSEFSLHSMYEKLNINSDYARRLFVKEFGQTPSHFLKLTRIAKAKELLLNTDAKYTVYDISVQSGFSDPYHFSKTFKQVTGLSPSSWKKQNLAK